MNKKQNALTWNAVPTLFDTPNVVNRKRTRRIIVRHKTDIDVSAAHPECWWIAPVGEKLDGRSDHVMIGR